MPEDKPLPSAYEIAMARLRAKDRDEGVEEARPLSDAEKAEIAELRREAKAKLAEMEILHRKNLAGAAADPAALAKIEDAYRVDRARIEDRLETKIAKIKRGDAPRD